MARSGWRCSPAAARACAAIILAGTLHFDSIQARDGYLALIETPEGPPSIATAFQARTPKPDDAAISAAIFKKRLRPRHFSWSLSRVVMSSPINRKALMIVERGPNAATARFAATMAARYKAIKKARPTCE